MARSGASPFVSVCHSRPAAHITYRVRKAGRGGGAGSIAAYADVVHHRHTKLDELTLQRSLQRSLEAGKVRADHLRRADCICPDGLLLRLRLALGLWLVFGRAARRAGLRSLGLLCPLARLDRAFSATNKATSQTTVLNKPPVRAATYAWAGGGVTLRRCDFREGLAGGSGASPSSFA